MNEKGKVQLTGNQIIVLGRSIGIPIWRQFMKYINDYYNSQLDQVDMKWLIDCQGLQYCLKPLKYLGQKFISAIESFKSSQGTILNVDFEMPINMMTVFMKQVIAISCANNYFIKCADKGVVLTQVYKQRFSQRIRQMVYKGIFGKLSAAYFFDNQHINAACVNVVDPNNYYGTVVGSPTLTSDGLTGNTSNYINTNFIPDDVNFKLNNCSVIVYSMSDDVGTNMGFTIRNTDSSTGTNGCRINEGKIRGCLNSSTFGTANATIQNTIGLLAWLRRESGKYVTNKDGYDIETITSTATEFSTTAFHCLQDTRTASFVAFGAALTNQELTDLKNILETT